MTTDQIDKIVSKLEEIRHQARMRDSSSDVSEIQSDVSSMKNDISEIKALLKDFLARRES